MDSKVAVLYISYDGMTDPLGSSQVLPYVFGLSKKGFSFTLISAEKKVRYNKDKESIENLCKQHNVDWNPIIYTKTPAIFSTIWDIYKIRSLTKKLHQQKTFKIIHCRSYISAIIGLGFKMKHNVGFIFDMRGFYADERVDGKIWNLSNPIFKWIYNYFKRKEKEFLNNSDYNITLTKAAKKEIHGWQQIDNQPANIEVIPCCTDTELFSKENIQPEFVNKRKAGLGIREDDFVVSYIGSIGTWYMLEEMLDFFKVILKHKPNAKFLLITMDEASRVKQGFTSRDMQLNRLLVTSGYRNEMPSLISLSSISLFFIYPVYSKMASCPTKMGEIMGMGIPVVCNAGVGDVDSILEGTNTGLLVQSFDFKEYSRIIEQLDTICLEPKDKIAKVASDYFSLEKGIEKFESVYKHVLNKNN